MFGKTKDPIEHDGTAEGDLTVDDFFGDEAAVAETVRVDHLQHRVTQVEQQINSQFTSLAAYAQIAQEQVEMVRSEALHANERSEQKVIALIERERSDRLADATGVMDVTARLDALDAQIEEIRQGLQLCLSNQKALADAITDLFQPAMTPPSQPAPAPTAAPVPEPVPVQHVEPAPHVPTPIEPSGDESMFASDEAPTLGSFPPPLGTASTSEPVSGDDSVLTDGPIAGLSLD